MPSRGLASRLQVARASVVSAYEQLLDEGYVSGRGFGHVHLIGSSGALRAALGFGDKAATEQDVLRICSGAGIRARSLIPKRVRRDAVQHGAYPTRCA